MATEKLHLLVSADSDEAASKCRDRLGDGYEVITSDDCPDGEIEPAAVLFTGEFAKRANDLRVCAHGFFDSVPDGLVLIDGEQTVVWHNEMFRRLSRQSDSQIGRSFWVALGEPEIVGQDLLTAGNEPTEAEPVTRRVLLMPDRTTYLEMRVVRSRLQVEHSETRTFTSVTLRDITAEVRDRQKLEAIHKAGRELQDLAPADITDLPHAARIDLLKENILQFAQDILDYDAFEIRQLNPETNELEPLIAVGMSREAAERRLYAAATGNGVTGFVAATRKSHLCSDTEADDHYIEGVDNARTAMTVPLIMHEDLLGTFNVEGPGSRQFNKKDLQFLEIFGAVVAQALNQLQLMLAEKYTTTDATSRRLLREFARPADSILNDATDLERQFLGHNPDICEVLRRIQDSVREIRSRIGEDPDDQSTRDYCQLRLPQVRRPGLRSKKIMVIDDDGVIQQSAHDLLEAQGCIVESYRCGELALQALAGHRFDAVLTAIRLTDMGGYEAFHRIRKVDEHVPIIFTKGFGWDQDHTEVKLRVEGLKPILLYKPFRTAQLLDTLENVMGVSDS